MQAHPDIFHIPARLSRSLTVELYLVKGERSILIDSGAHPFAVNCLVRDIENLGVRPEAIDVVLNTHGHPDHIGGNQTIASFSNARVWIHESDSEYLTDAKGSFRKYLAPVMRACGSAMEDEERFYLDGIGPSIPPDGLLKDGDTIDAGQGVLLECVHLPGHTNGSVGFFWEREGVFFSGDAVAGLHVEKGKLPIIQNLPHYLESLEKIRQMSIRLLFCGHPYRGIHLPAAHTRNDGEVRRFIDDSLELGRRLADAVESVRPYRDEKSFVELADEVVSALPGEMGFLPISQIPKPMITPQAVFYSLYGP